MQKRRPVLITAAAGAAPRHWEGAESEHPALPRPLPAACGGAIEAALKNRYSGKA